MAKAPKVKPGGYEAAGKRIAAAQQVFRITVPTEPDPLSFTYAPANVPIRVRALVRDLHGVSLDEFLFGRGNVDVQTYADLWWISRLIDGDNVTRTMVHDEWDERCGGIPKEDISDELVEDDVDDPKASEPVTSTPSLS